MVVLEAQIKRLMKMVDNSKIELYTDEDIDVECALRMSQKLNSLKERGQLENYMLFPTYLKQLYLEAKRDIFAEKYFNGVVDNG